MLAVYWKTLYPVGSIYISTSSTFNPQTAWGGTWRKTSNGRCLIGANDTYPLGSTGGESTHTLTIEEMPTHRHSSSRVNWYNDLQNNGIDTNIAAQSHLKADGPDTYTAYAGGSKAHNNMQPYLAVYIWERTE
jgi:microcystin-dependent protein